MQKREKERKRRKEKNIKRERERKRKGMVGEEDKFIEKKSTFQGGAHENAS